MNGNYKTNIGSISGSARKHEFLDEHRDKIEPKDIDKPLITNEFTDIDSFLIFLIYISKNIETISYELQFNVVSQISQYIKNEIVSKNNVDKLQHINQYAPLELINIFQNTSCIHVLAEVLNIVDYWLIIDDLSSNVWVSEDFVLPVIALASEEKVSLAIREKSINVINKLIYTEKENVTKMFECSKIMARFTKIFSDSFISRYSIAQFLNTYFLIAKDYKFNDILILGDIFNTLPESMNEIYFPLLLSCLMNIDTNLGNHDFMAVFMEKVNVGLIFSEFYQKQFDPQSQIISFFMYFVESGNDFMLSCCFENFQWIWLIKLFQNPEFEKEERSMERRDVVALIRSIVLAWPDSLKMNGAEIIADYLCSFFNGKSYSEKNEILVYIAEMLNSQNLDLFKKLRSNNFIEEAVAHIQATESVRKVLLIAMHQMAVFAENTQQFNIVENMKECGFMDTLIELTKSEDTVIAEMAQSFLNDTNILIFHSFVTSEEM